MLIMLHSIPLTVPDLIVVEINIYPDVEINILVLEIFVRTKGM